MNILNETNYQTAISALCQSEADFAQVIEKYGNPPTWFRAEGFPTLLHIILEQQVSLASAKACFDKLNAACEPLTPEFILRFSDEELKTIGFSRQKTLYARELAKAVGEKRLDLENLANLTDDEVRVELTKIKGIGNWTVDIYLLMCLRRADFFPFGDLALQVAWKELKNLEKRPTAEELEKIGAKWKPFRAVAARILWHFYLQRKNR